MEIHHEIAVYKRLRRKLTEFYTKGNTHCNWKRGCYFISYCKYTNFNLYISTCFAKFKFVFTELLMFTLENFQCISEILVNLVFPQGAEQKIFLETYHLHSVITFHGYLISPNILGDTGMLYIMFGLIKLVPTIYTAHLKLHHTYQTTHSQAGKP